MRTAESDSAGIARPLSAGLVALSLLPLVVFLVFSPFYDSLGAPVSYSAVSLMDWQRLTELFAVSVAFLILCGALWAPGACAAISLPAVQMIGWAIFFALGAFSCADAAYPRYAWIEWSWLVVCLLATALIARLSDNAYASFGALVRLFALAAVASYTPLYYMRNSDPLFDPSWPAEPVLLGFNNPRVFSDYQTVLVCLLPWALRVVSPARWLRIAAWTLAGCYVALALVMGSRSLLLGQLVAAGGVVALFGGARCRAYVIGQLRLWLIGAAVYLLLFVLIPTLAADGVLQLPVYRLRYDSSGRLELWLAAWHFALANPWLGIGPMHFAAELNRIAASPHNQVLQVIAEYGLIAGSLFVVLFGHWLTAVCRGIRSTCSAFIGSDEDAWLFALSLFAALLALLAQSLVSPVFNNPHSQVLLVLVGGVLGGYQRWSAAQRVLLVRRSVVFMVLIAALGVFSAISLPWALTIAQRNSCYVHSTDKPTSFFAPRFWQQGWLFMPCEPEF